MDDFQEMERFGMVNDYDDGQWIFGEFYGKRKQKATQTKDDILYGVFSTCDSDSNSYEGSSSKKRMKDLSKKPNFTKSVDFVSTSTIFPNQEIDNNSLEENKLGEKDVVRSAGLGFGSLARMGFDATSSENAMDDMGYTQSFSELLMGSS